MLKLSEIDSLEIKITASATKADQALDRLVNTLNETQNALRGTNAQADKLGSSKGLSGAADTYNRKVKSATKSTFSFARAIGTFYANYYLIVRGVKALGNAIKDTADYFEAFNYFNVALTKIGEDFSDDFGKWGYESAEAYAESFATRLQDKLSTLSGLQISDAGTLVTTDTKNLGLNIQEITQFSAQLASVTNSVGQVGEVSLATSSAFTKLASDMSSLFNIDYSQVATNLQSGLIGQSRALYKYGIDITNATLQTYAYKLGVEKAVSEMTQAEKMQLRMIAILDQSRVSWGDQSRTINSLANQMRILENNLSEVSLVLGQLFVPLMTKSLPIINGFSIAIKSLLVNMASVFGVKIDTSLFGKGFNDVEDDFEDQEEQIKNNQKALEEYKNQLMGFDEVNKLQDQDATSNLNANNNTLNLTEDILKAIEEYEKAWQEAYDGMTNDAQKWSKFFEKVLQPIKDIFTHFKWGYDMDFDSFGADVAGLTTKLTETINKAIEKIDWNGIGYRFGQFFQGSASESFNNLGNVASTISNLIKGINNFIASAIESVDWKQHTQDLVRGLTNFFKNLDIDGIFESVERIGNAVNSMFVEIWDYALENPDEIIELIATFYVKVVEFGVSAAEAFFTNLGDLISKWFKTLFKNSIGKAKKELIDDNPVTKTLHNVFEDGANAWESGTFGEWFCEKIKKVFSDAWNSFSNWFSTTELSKWWKNFSQNFSMEKFRDTMGSIKEAFSRRWNSLKNWFEGTAVSEWWAKFKENFKAEKWTNALSGIKDGFEKAFNNAISAIKTIWNNFANSLNAKLSFTIEAFNNPFTGQQLWSDITVNLGKIPKFATGGFPEDGLFYANHNELVGKFSNGKTAVANNDQITSGIEQASYRGMARALAEYSGNGGNVTVVLQGDADGLFRVVQNKANNYARQTGQPAFII